MNKVEKIKAEIERLKQQFMSQADSFHSLGMEEKENHCAILASNMAALIRYIDSLEEEPVSNDLEEAADNYVGHAPEIDEDLSCFTKRNAFIAGAQWQKEQLMKNSTFINEVEWGDDIHKLFREKGKKSEAYDS